MPAARRMARPIETFDFPEGFILSRKYRVIRKVGEGWEGEVYIVEELFTNIERAAKIFFPHRNQNNRTAKFYAKKLHKLRTCSVLVQYLTQERIYYRGHEITYLISEFVEGKTLDSFLETFPGKRMSPFQAVHLLYALARGLEEVHRLKEYHGDLHYENIMVQRYGLAFELKVFDMFRWGSASPENIRDDVCNLIRIFYDCLGGSRFYPRQPEVVKDICCGLKRSLILKKFRNAGELRLYLEKMNWN